MSGFTYVTERQKLWACRRGLRLEPWEKGGEATYCPKLSENLYVPLSDSTTTEFQQGDGRELKRNMKAVYSSSALAVNLFEYWRQRSIPKAIADVCEIPISRLHGMRFEGKFPIAENVKRSLFPRDPNVDVILDYAPGNALERVGIEVKFREPYDPHGHPGLSASYLRDCPWFDGLQNLKELAKSICPSDRVCKCLHRAQLIKHVLGLKHACAKRGKRGFRLLYLWYDVPSDEGHCHRQEIAEFSRAAKADGVQFQAMTVQKLIMRLAKGARAEHEEFVDYLAERYL